MDVMVDNAGNRRVGGPGGRDRFDADRLVRSGGCDLAVTGLVVYGPDGCELAVAGRIVADRQLQSGGCDLAVTGQMVADRR